MKSLNKFPYMFLIALNLCASALFAGCLASQMDGGGANRRHIGHDPDDNGSGGGVNSDPGVVSGGDDDESGGGSGGGGSGGGGSGGGGSGGGGGKDPVAAAIQAEEVDDVSEALNGEAVDAIKCAIQFDGSQMTALGLRYVDNSTGKKVNYFYLDEKTTSDNYEVFLQAVRAGANMIPDEGFVSATDISYSVDKWIVYCATGGEYLKYLNSVVNELEPKMASDVEALVKIYDESAVLTPAPTPAPVKPVVKKLIPTAEAIKE